MFFKRINEKQHIDNIKLEVKKALCLFMTAVIVSNNTPVFDVFADSEEEQEVLDNMIADMGEAERILAELEESKANIEEYIVKLDEQLTNINKELYNIKKKLKKVKKKIKKTKVKLKAQEEDIAEQYASMKLRIQFMYEEGDAKVIDLLLGSDDFSDFLNKVEYITDISAYDRNMLDKMKETKAAIEETKATLEEKQDELVALKDEQEEKQETTEKLLEAKADELAETDSKIAAAENSIKSMEADISDQMDVVSEMKEAESRIAAEEAAKKAKKNDSEGETTEDSTIVDTQTTTTGWMWPLPGYTTLSSQFGYRTDPIDGTTSYHCGIDIPAPSGTNIYAVADGTVAWATSNASAGNWTGIYHGDGLYSVYMHQSVMLVSPGDTVHKGDVIGLVGSTGRSTGAHLHLSVRLNGSYVEPLNYVSP